MIARRVAPWSAASNLPAIVYSHVRGLFYIYAYILTVLSSVYIQRRAQKGVMFEVRGIEFEV